MRRHPLGVLLAVVVSLAFVLSGPPAIAVALDDGADWFETGLMPPTHDFPGAPRTLPFMDRGTLAPTSAGTTVSTDVYRFHLNAGDSIEVSARAFSGSGAIGIQMYRADASDSCATDAGSVTGIFSEGRTARLSYVPTEEGCYRVVVRNLSGGTTTMDYAVAASSSNVGDNSPGSARPAVPLPFLVKDFVDSLVVPELPAGDSDDYLSAELVAGHAYTFVFTRQSGSVADLLLFRPDTGAQVGLGGGVGKETVVYTAPVNGTYRVVVRARAGSAGRYALSVSEGKVQCSLTIFKSTSAVRWGRPFILSGGLTNGQVGDLVVVWVRKPGKRYWSYSSNRLCYTASAAGAAWWYRYTPIGRTSPRGPYYFKASYPGDDARSGSATPNQVVVSVR